ncbi:hypothetical protein BGZ65_000580 [Modicella reniformis]|uniref:Phosphoglycerate mutase n=1 Tax=Modicella reniformis TaxID=1440133 RepID=A0A9P6MJA8_9FUNG|nr:hypothetical protein BGZ65_000580 [Modicella reniformis]
MKFILFRHGHSLANQESRIVSSLENGTQTSGGPEGTGFGLSARGKQEVAESAQSLLQYVLASSHPGQRVKVHILTSPFQRTRQTSLIIDSVLRATALDKQCPTVLNLHTPLIESKVEIEGEEEPEHVCDLRERFFGDFEMKTPSDELYAQVWHEDAKNPFHEIFGVESVAAVTNRMTGVVRDQEAKRKETKKQRRLDTKAILQDTATADPEMETEETWIVLVSHGDSLQILQAAMRGWSGDRHRQVEHLNTAEWRNVEWCKELAEAHQ